VFDKVPTALGLTVPVITYVAVPPGISVTVSAIVPVLLCMVVLPPLVIVAVQDGVTL
jgi:hypothetical protein